MKRWLYVGLAALVLATSVWLTQGPLDKAIEEPAATVKPRRLPVVPESMRAEGRPPAKAPNKPSERAMKAMVADILEKHRDLYGYAGMLDYDDAKALIEKRRKTSAEYVRRLAKLGSGGSRAISGMYDEAGATHQKMLLIDALGQIEDEEAVPTLETLFKEEDGFSMRKEIIGSLAERPEAEAGDAIADILDNEEKSRLRFNSVQALSGREGSLDTLADHLRNDPNRDVRLESINAVARVGSDAARNVLAEVAHGDTDVRVRQTAIQELARSFGDAALADLQILMEDPNKTIRKNAARAMQRIQPQEQQAATE